MSDRTKNPLYCIPEDQDGSTYRFIIVSAKRARQLQNGQRSVLPASNKKPTVLAMEETRRGLVPFVDPALADAELEQVVTE
jgi:DNA-directed RNA polymerase subunit omega